MKAKINEKMICIPPYVSTSWDHVTFMQAKDNPMQGLDLIMHLDNGAKIEIENLDKALIDLAFAAHLKFMEVNSKKQESPLHNPNGFFQQIFGLSPNQMEGMPIRFGITGMPGFENIETAMQHDSSKADTENLPKELLDKIAKLTHMVLGGDISTFPKPEPHCNCPHCQIARAFHGIEKEDLSEQEDEVSENELTFQDWKIEQIDENLYCVTNPIDIEEHYQVYLGSPVGCTCGHNHCEHIEAVLRS